MDAARPATLNRHKSMYIPAPASLTPLQPPAPPFQPPPMNRRHSSMNPRRPLRSSPLAGPALSSEGVVDDEDTTPKARPSRIASTPELSSERPGSSMSLYMPRWEGSRGTTPDTSAPDIPPIPPLPAHAQPTISEAPQPSRRASLLSMKSLIRKKSKASVRSAAAPSPSSSVPPPPPGAIAAPVSETHGKKNAIGLDRARARSVTSLPERGARARAPARHNSDADVGALHTPSRATPQDSSWLTHNTYAETPRFSRLGLGSGVVMPVPAKASRRLSREPSSTSMRSVSPSGRASPPHTTPSLSLTRTRSNSSSRESVLSEPPVLHSSAASIASTGSECAPIREEAEEDEGIVIGRRSEQPESHEARRQRSRSEPRSRWGSMRSMRSLSRKAIGDATSAAPASGKRLSFLSFGPGSDNAHELVKPVPLSAKAGGPVGATAMKMEVTLPAQPVPAAPEKVAPRQPEVPKRKNTARRFMRTLSTVGRRQATI
ncbi:hypothetical protein BD626DRAFT_23367 [Schizophyllum amplum]|uniref:Uncharacterized protein n=1 Tax=Schizophyllum amplum TaxID=97359 RepID=A0A550CZ86_9AGAR|nr:hypothetical protein BD626DRAFT_23367 [Auriculariopsis ampla]